MEIKEAVEIVKSNGGFAAALISTKEPHNTAYRVIEDAICNGYALCNVEDITKRMENRKYQNPHGEFEMFNKAIDECIRELKEG